MLGAKIVQELLVGKIASIDRGWLRKAKEHWKFILQVGKIASIDRGWLQRGLALPPRG